MASFPHKERSDASERQCKRERASWMVYRPSADISGTIPASGVTGVTLVAP